MKKLLSVFLSFLMVVSLSACKPSEEGTSEAETKPETETATETETAAEEETASEAGGEYSFKVWCADNIVDLTKSQLEKFAEAHPEYSLSFTVEAVGEGDAATSMITDVEAGGDIYCFAQDQLARLAQSNALAKPGVKAAETINNENDSSGIAAATFDKELWAYPLTSDNGYFMYYDKSVVSEDHLGDLTAILDDCVKANKTFAFEGTTSAWYIASLFFGTGCVSEWNMNGTDIVSYNDTFNSDEGLIAAKGLKEIVTSPAFTSSSGADAFSANPAAAVLVSGTWAYSDVEAVLGENLGAAALPSFTVDGQTYHMGSFSGNKLVGVKPQTDAEKAAVASQIALWLTGEECQSERFDAVAWGPSNKAAADSDAVRANPALVALAAQNEYGVPQGQYPGSWWDIGKAIGSEIFDLGANSTDDDLKKVLQSYSDSLEALLTVDPEVARAWTVIGSVMGGDWSEDIEMTEDPEGTWTTADLELKAGEEFKVRQGQSWDANLGSDGADGANFVVEEDGTYQIQLVVGEDWTTGTVELIKK